HTLIGLGYVIPMIQSRFAELDYRYMEASLDLGATPTQTLVRVTLPLLLPAVIASSVLVFIISLDDFVISFFTAGGATQTLPMYIFSLIRSGETPLVNAVSTILLVMSSLAVLVYSLLTIKKTEVSE
ncbi:MAG: ABC transporter permease subunit, partial [Candidatus Dependentiae bacterium]|nr:ABC transporter permease subunit [Candidatus Dependentiae bacterium]